MIFISLKISDDDDCSIKVILLLLDKYSLTLNMFNFKCKIGGIWPMNAGGHNLFCFGGLQLSLLIKPNQTYKNIILRVKKFLLSLMLNVLLCDFLSLC